ncbi:unnamed protein product [Caenorhabditis bovis]|uniref:SET domain-containing protein n=1 Tax=Caenorhabditis bovis TaxID=2654633 RepID=A0A8S1EQB6_9PELO|nr:unnamed protein product [Caenorhabditis bovis]
MEYDSISTSVRGEGIRLEDWEDELEGCECEEGCSTESRCSCLMGDEDNYSRDGKLLPSSVNRPLLECHSQCACSLLPSCRNRLVQNGITKNLEVFRTSQKGFGVKTLESIEPMEFVCEYAGEIISENEVQRRYQENEYEDNYTLTIKEHCQDNIRKTFIDPRNRGNIGRFLNHSCSPNCDIVIVRIGRIIPTVGLFANRKIEVGEELTYDYGSSTLDDEKYRKICHCRSENCRGFLPMSATPIE